MSRRCISVRALSPFERRVLDKQFRHPADARAGRNAFAFLDEAEFHLNPHLSRMWVLRGHRATVDSAGQNRRGPVFGALDTSGDLACMVTGRKRSAEFLTFLEWLRDDVYADQAHVFLFLDNGSIHKTKAVWAWLQTHKDHFSVIWNAPYTPNLNGIERIWGQLKRASINNYYFKTVENLEKAVLRRIKSYYRNHPPSALQAKIWG